jgi:beta-glucosidase
LIDARPADHRAQEDSVRLHWTGAGAAMAAIAGDAPINLTRESNGGLAVELEFRIDAAPTADVSLLMQCSGKVRRRLPGRQRVQGGAGWPVVTPRHSAALL